MVPSIEVVSSNVDLIPPQPSLSEVIGISPSKLCSAVYEDGSTRVAPLFDTVRVAELLHGERKERNLRHADYIFIDKYNPASLEKMKMQRDALRSLTAVNAGGKSVLSEMLSMQYFSQVYSAESILLEKEVEYWVESKMVDYVCSVKGVRVGVSVTRAMSYPTPDKFNMEYARELLNKKLYGLIVSRNAVTAKHTFFKSVLHVWCQTTKIASYVKRAYEEMDLNDYGLDVKGVVVLLLTVCDESYVYTDRRPSDEAIYRSKVNARRFRPRTPSP